MAKKKTGKVIQMLSPENYIRKKARSLPIDECWINPDWEENGLAHITIARRHTNDKYTVGLFLVDLKCLGVKDSQYLFNMQKYEYEELLEATREELDIEKTNYPLIHNIILASIEFAEEYGFKPHKDYTSVTQFMLDEDTDDIELIDIDCGYNGKPLYVKGPLEDDSQAKRIIAQLEETAGPGNYKFVDATTGFHEKYNEPKENDPFDGMPISKKVDLFNDYLSRLESSSEAEKDEFSELISSLLKEEVNWDKFDSYSTHFSDQLKCFQISDGFNSEMLGDDSQNIESPNELLGELNEIEELISTNTKLAEQKLKLLSKQYKNNPLIEYLKLNLIEFKHPKRYESQVELFHLEHSNYPLARLLWYNRNLRTEEEEKELISLHNVLEIFFPNKKLLSKTEIYYALLHLLLNSIKAFNLEQVIAIEDLIDTIEFNEKFNEGLLELSSIFKFQYIQSLGNKNYGSDTTFQFKIQVKGITKPPIWRRVIVPSNLSFFDFHAVIQTAMGWYNQHLFQFSPKGFGSYPQISLPSEDDDDDFFDFGFQETLDAEETFLDDIFTKEMQKFTYTYDFGDSWEHQITLEKILDTRCQYPEILEGKGACPPEDCGGIHEYSQIKKVIADPKHPEWEELHDWLFGNKEDEFDPNAFDLEEHQSIMQAAFPHENE